MGELLEALAGVAGYVALFALLAWALYYAFGPAVLGVPAMVAVLVVIAGLRIFSNAGIAGLAAVVVGLAAIVVVIGMAMNVGSKRSEEPRPDTPPKEP